MTLAWIWCCRMLRNVWRTGVPTALVCLHAAGATAATVPAPHPPAPPGWFHIVPIDQRTYAISEPQYWQRNVSYLLIGARRAVLFDTGPGIYSIRSVVRTLTTVPIIVIPSHLHFDHVGDNDEFEDVRLLDTPSLRSQVHIGELVETAPQYLLRTPMRFHVHDWLKDGSTLDLGGRKVMVLSTPGHTPDSMSLVDIGANRLFTGDLVNRIVTFCNVPGSDVGAMAGSLHRLLKVASGATAAYEAHSETPITRPELKQLADGIGLIAMGQAHSALFCLGGMAMKKYSVESFAILLPVSADGALRPLASVTQTLRSHDGECSASEQRYYLEPAP